MIPVDVKRWTLRDFPLSHRYTESIILQEIIDWLYEYMGPGQPGPILDDHGPDFAVAHYGPGWIMEIRSYQGFWTDGTYHPCHAHFIHFESEAHEVMFRLIWH
jgi:hypothetical protein